MENVKKNRRVRISSQQEWLDNVSKAFNAGKKVSPAKIDRAIRNVNPGTKITEESLLQVWSFLEEQSPLVKFEILSRFAFAYPPTRPNTAVTKIKHYFQTKCMEKINSIMECGMIDIEGNINKNFLKEIYIKQIASGDNGVTPYLNYALSFNDHTISDPIRGIQEHVENFHIVMGVGEGKGYVYRKHGFRCVTGLRYLLFRSVLKKNFNKRNMRDFKEAIILIQHNLVAQKESLKKLEVSETNLQIKCEDLKRETQNMKRQIRTREEELVMAKKGVNTLRADVGREKQSYENLKTTESIKQSTQINTIINEINRTVPYELKHLKELSEDVDSETSKMIMHRIENILEYLELLKSKKTLPQGEAQ